jgi:hypothetical protein
MARVVSSTGSMVTTVAPARSSGVERLGIEAVFESVEIDVVEAQAPAMLVDHDERGAANVPFDAEPGRQALDQRRLADAEGPF